MPGLLSNLLEASTSFVSNNWALLAVAAVVLTITWVLTRSKPSKERLPPHVPYWVPFVGNTIQFGIHPVNFLLANYKKYGEVFSVQIVGRTMTYFITPDANAFFINARSEDVSAGEAYAAVTVPVFGKDVVYDVDNAILVEQKKMVKIGLNREVFQVYVPTIQQETEAYFTRWGNSGEADVLVAFSEVAIMTASACLMGAEIRSVLDEEVAKLYHDLEQGFTPLNFMFPYVPFPGNYRRDIAQAKMRNLFIRVINERRAKKGVEYSDMLDNLMRQEYKNGEKLKDHQVAHLLIALLMAGQHTSSTTLAWFTSYLAKHPEWQQKLRDERRAVQGDDTQALDFATLEQLPLLDLCLKETLRLSPPLLTLMRKVIQDIEYKDYTIPAGHYICVSPNTTHRLSEVWTNPHEFDPERFLSPREEDIKGGKFSYIPFGAGRHRCIGEQFAYLQVKAIMSTFLQLFDVQLTEQGFPEIDFTSMVVLPKAPKVIYKRRSPVV